MDFDELFGSSTTVKIKWKGATLHHEFKDPTSAQDFEYRRRSAKIIARKGRIESSDDALDAGLWLWHQLIQSVKAENGNGIAEDVPREKWNLIRPDVKLTAIAAFLADVERVEGETLRD